MNKQDIKNILRQVNLNDIPVLLYQEIRQLENMIFLYDGPTMGHWCCLLDHGNGWEFFDPEGIFVDEEFKFQNVTKRKHILSILMGTADEMNPKLYFDYNNKNFQRSGNTCGLWCIFRMIHKNLGCEQFLKSFRNVRSEDIANYFHRPDLLH